MSAVMAIAAPTDDFIAAAAAKHGDFGKKAAAFLVDGMPEKDRFSLDAGFLTENLDLALKARAGFPWAAKVPEEIFLNDVLPYAVFDETRESWRAEFLEKARPIVKDCKTASQAAQALNKEFFNAINVHYHTGRKAPNQSPKESMTSGRATCTGLSIILVDACRAVGIPARAVGTPMWSNGRGNHTWVEIWDGGWHFTGADEYDAQGLNRGWFTGDAAQARADKPENAIYATSWKRDGLAFPMVWNIRSQDTSAVNVTDRYAKAAPVSASAKVGVRLFENKGGGRIVASMILTDGAVMHSAMTKAGTADLNDMPRFDLKPGARGFMFLTMEGETRELAFGPLEAGDPTIDIVWTDLAKSSPAIARLVAWMSKPAAERRIDDPALRVPMNKQDAAKALALLGADRLTNIAAERKEEFEKKSLKFGDKTLRWKDRVFGKEPAGGHSLWISMHGGGGAPPAVNDQQWSNQVNLYEVPEGIYVAPRAPTDTWNLWHEAHIDPMFQRLIEDYIAFRGVNPDKIHLMGYSAGGDGVWQLAPRMADRFASAAMMAGHPNEASLLGLRNLPFAIFMGGNDAAYDRNKIAAHKTAELDQLAKDDPGGYVHMSRIYEGLGHWMNRKDGEAIPWMAKFQRNTWPKKVVWLQDDITHDRFYWLRISNKDVAKAGQKIIATVSGQTIRIDGDVPTGITLRVSDQLLDLDQAITVIANGKQVFSAKVPRTAAAIRQSLAERADIPAAAVAEIRLK